MNDERVWVHNEAPEGKPSAAAYRIGCRCSECKEANAQYMRDYRARRVDTKENLDGTAFYHSHKGQPSKRTARNHLCVHPRCLDLAGLVLVDGVVRVKANMAIDPTWGAVIAPATISTADALAALRAKLVA